MGLMTGPHLHRLIDPWIRTHSISCIISLVLRGGCHTIQHEHQVYISQTNGM